MPDNQCRVNPPRRLLMGPGPSPVEPRVYEAIARPIVGHLDAYFFETVAAIHDLLDEVFGTSNNFTVAISGTGTSGMETAVSNFVESSTKVAVLANGYFSERISDMVRRQGATLVRLEKTWGDIFDDDEARDFILREKPGVVALVHAETSTGVAQPRKAICEAAHEAGALVISDEVTSLGNIPVAADDTGIDIAYSCTQKGLACPPGLAPVTVSPRAMEWLRARQTMNRSFYFDLKLLDQYFLSAHRYHHTAPISMFYALREALEVIHEEGLENRYARIRRNHQAFVAGCEAMGMTMFVPEGKRLYPLNTPVVPEGVNDGAVRKRMMDEDGIEILGGLGPMAGKIFRIGIMGAGSTKENVLLLLESFERALRAEGYKPAANGKEAAAAYYARTANVAG